MSRIVLNKKNYFHNLSILSEKAGSKNKLAVVLKDNAYGHGLLEIAKLAKEFGITKAVVKSYEEALKIEDYFQDIIILAESKIHTYSHTFHIVINELEQIFKLPQNTQVHLKIDTGMHRNGISKDDLKVAIDGLYKQKLKLTGIMTHHRSADKLSSEFYWQNHEFGLIKNEVKKLCEQLFLPLPIFHSCNSSALLRTSNFSEDLARVGIASYGYVENDPIFENVDLKPVLSLWANKISTRVIRKNQCVGYGGTFISSDNLTISTYDIGYGDGFLRINEHKSYSTPDGHKVLGRVSMDNLSLDSSKKEVCIFDDARVLAKLHDTITYEITTTLSPYLKREII